LISTLGLGGAANAAILTDIIMIVDESGSMGQEQVNLRNNIGLFASILSAGGVSAQYGLVGYGSSIDSARPRMLTDLTDPASFATAALGLVASGGTEPAYTASAYALNALDGQSDLFSFRSNAVKNIVIFTDEPSNGDTVFRGTVGGSAVTSLSLDQLLTDNNALYNAVLTGEGTIFSIGGLATNHGGNIYDLGGLSSNNTAATEAFVTAFANSKLQEILDFCDLNPNDPACGGGPTSVPEPGTLGLLAIGLLGAGALRRKRTV
jgi:hypothetical protein